MKNIELKVKYRKKKGSQYNKKIRKKNLIPGIIYGKNKNNILIKINHNNIYNKIFKNQNKKEIIFNIKIKKKIIKTKIKNIQKHPYKNKILHIDFIYYKI